MNENSEKTMEIHGFKIGGIYKDRLSGSFFRFAGTGRSAEIGAYMTFIRTRVDLSQDMTPEEAVLRFEHAPFDLDDEGVPVLKGDGQTPVPEYTVTAIYSRAGVMLNLNERVSGAGTHIDLHTREAVDLAAQILRAAGFTAMTIYDDSWSASMESAEA